MRTGCRRTITTPSCHILTTSIICVLQITITKHSYTITEGFKPLSTLVVVRIAAVHKATDRFTNPDIYYNILIYKIYYNIIFSSVLLHPASKARWFGFADDFFH